MGFFWPKISDPHSANRACTAASGVAFFIVIVMSVIVYFKTSGKIEWGPKITPMAYINIGIFFIVGLGFKFHSRYIAAIGTVFFIVQKIIMMIGDGHISYQVLGTVVFGLVFIHGTRGAFVWGKLRKKELTKEGDLSMESSTHVKKPKLPQNFLRTVILLLILVLVGGGAFFYLKSNEQVSGVYSALGSKAKSLINLITPKFLKNAGPIPKGPLMKLELKSGRVFEGILVKKNDEGYWLYVEGTGQVYFSPGEILKAE